MPRANPPKPAAAKKPRAPKGGHQLAAALPEGEVLRDSIKGEWKLGKPIGSGGFGLIYLADRNSTASVPMNAPYVMKLEPHSNGPLFCELHFYQRAAKAEYIEQWVKAKKLKSLGVPKYVCSGTYERKGTKYRFMVMERYDTDLQKLFEQNGKCFPEGTVYMLAIKLLNALEYLHEKEYVHADIKGSNLMAGYAKGKADEVYLVDYGLATRYMTQGEHKEYKEDPRKAHDGTIEFTSRDAHKGVAPSRRGDLEILGYCLLQWLCGGLPWEDKLNDKNYVRDQKIKYMSDIKSLMRKCFPSGNVPGELEKFVRYAANLHYADTPDYNKCRQLFKQALKRLGLSETGRLELSAANGVRAKSPVKGGKKRVADAESSPSPRKQVKASAAGSTPGRTPKAATPRRRKEVRPGAGARGTPAVAVSPGIRPTPGVIPPGLIASSKAKAVKRLDARENAKRRIRKRLVESATQTSPGLKGLRRTRKKRN